MIPRIIYGLLAGLASAYYSSVDYEPVHTIEGYKTDEKQSQEVIGSLLMAIIGDGHFDGNKMKDGGFCGVPRWKLTEEKTEEEVEARVSALYGAIIKSHQDEIYAGFKKDGITYYTGISIQYNSLIDVIKQMKNYLNSFIEEEDKRLSRLAQMKKLGDFMEIKYYSNTLTVVDMAQIAGRNPYEGGRRSPL